MDVSVYPPPPQPLSATDLTRLGQLSYQDQAFGNNKLDGDAMFLGMTEAGLDFGSNNQFRVPQPPMTKGTPPNNGAQNWRREGNMADSHRLPWSYSVGDDDYNIPPLTPPTLPEHMMPPHLPHETPPGQGQYHPLDPPSRSGPHHQYQLQGLEMSRMSSAQDGRTYSPEGGPMTSTLSVMQQMVNSDSRFTTSQQPIEAALGPRSQSAMSQQSQQNQLPTINPSQLGPNRNAITHNSPSPPGSKSATPSPSSSAHEDESEETLRVSGEKRPAGMDMKKPKTPKKKKRKDPNEPVKPVSAYALFFRDTQANIKAQNPNATFGEVSKIVASMWDGLGEEQKQEYKKRTETAKKEYLKQLAAYRASLVSQNYNDPSEMKPSHSSTPPSSSSNPMFNPKPPVYPVHPGQHPSSGSMPHSLPPHQHPGMYMYPHPPHSHMHPQLLSSRGTVPRPSGPHQGGLGGVAGAPTPPLQVSPPLHGQAHLGGLHSPHHHQQLTGHNMGMSHTSAIGQSYHPSLQSEYQQMGGGMLSGAPVMSSSVDYHQLGRHTPGHHPSLDWSTEYHGNGGLQRDKPLFLS
ncbi:thymocyte selection-associated high mobility group box protein TOX isoform X2 [Eucyclogobius newberryi]|uniref:thymocyte selection-associated high mobility group box protein TOX isoform X2 n=1 Tax=Eucyclogobius newberryi TaxID=166745 RepID=UPI003B5A7493